MKFKNLIFSASALYIGNFSAYADAPSLNITGINSNESISITLTVQNANNIKSIKFNGLDNFQLLTREVNFKTSSDNESENLFVSRYTLAPTKAESSNIYVTANVDGKTYNSNHLTFNVSQAQIDSFRKQQQQKAIANQKAMKKIQQDIDQQFKAQQKYFDDMNKMMRQQQEQMLKTQRELFKNFDSVQ